MKISITGASGFVGTHHKAPLRFSHDVSAMRIHYMPNQQINLKGDAIIHLAGKVHDLKKVSNPHDFYRRVIAPYKGALEMWYQENCSLFLDLQLILITALVIVFPKTIFYEKWFKDLPKREF